MKIYSYQEVAELCGYKTKAGLDPYIEAGIFPKPTTGNYLRKRGGTSSPYAWTEKAALDGFKLLTDFKKEKERVRLLKKLKIKEINKNKPPRERVTTRFNNKLSYDAAIKLMKVRAC